ncbi:MAG: hypothetical protein V2J89_15365 [Halieaceae bacterium]|jgi:hypothetical protein|nr:hypothetical protein [Halieaceae bacterium]
MRAFVCLVLSLASSLALAQQDLIELARQDIRAGRIGLVAASMPLTEEQEKVFWPIYREYADEQEALLDKRIAMLTEFADAYENMTADKARSIAAQSFAIQHARLERRERYFQRLSDALDPALAALFMQVDGQISTLLDFEMMQLTPLLKPSVDDAVAP